MKQCTWCGSLEDYLNETDNVGERLCDDCNAQYESILEEQGIEAY